MNNTMRLLTIAVSALLAAVLARALPARDYVIENDAMRRVVSVDTTVAITALTNKLTGRTYNVTSDEFKVVLDDTDFDFQGDALTARDFVLDGSVSLLDGGRKLVVPLKNEAKNLTVKVIYEADGPFYMHKWLEFSTLSGNRTISIVEVERMIIHEAAISLPNAKGSKKGNSNDGPVYADNFWLGVESPKFYNDFDGDYVWLYHYPNKVASVTNAVTSYKAVLGAADDDWKGDLRSNPIKDSFFKYIEEMRSTPIRFHRTYNLWNTCPAKEKDVLRIIESDIAPLHKAGLTFDTITIDHLWENKRSPTSGWYPSKEKWPNGFGKVQAELAKYGATLDIWLPIIMDAPVPIGSDAHKHMKERFAHYTSQGITGFKMDFAFYSHVGYQKAGIRFNEYQLEASNEGVFDIVRACRKINPDVVFYLTSSINRSPWWLMELNYIWERSTDFQEYRDEWHYTDCLLQHVPQNSWMHMGIPGPDIPHDSPKRYWKSREAMIEAERYSPIDYVFRGSMFFEVYARFSGTGIPMIVDLARFNENNFDILTQQPFVSGCTDMYYWAFYHKEEGGLIKFRNRSDSGKKMGITLDETIRLTENPGTAFELWKVDISPYEETRYKPSTFCYGDTFEVSMPKTTTPLIIRLKPAAK